MEDSEKQPSNGQNDKQKNIIQTLHQIPPQQLLTDNQLPSDNIPLTSPPSNPSTSPVSLSIQPTSLSPADLEEFVGTPFGFTSPPFEYPFPEPTGPITPSSSALELSLAPSPSLFVARGPLPGPPTTMAPVPPRPRSPTIAHPKLRSASPPVPPSLVRKRQRFSLGQIKRRRSGSVDSGHSAVSSTSSGSFDRRSTTDLRSSSSFASLLGGQSSQQTLTSADLGMSIPETRRVVSSPEVLPNAATEVPETLAEEITKENPT